MAKRELKSLSKSEIEVLISLVRSTKADLLSSVAVGMRIPREEQETMSKLEKRLEVQLACLSS